MPSMKILIDNGHGIDTPGKCSPDGTLREWAWAREVAQMLLDELTRRGIDAQRIVTEKEDIPLNRGADSRVRRVNAICDRYGAKNCLLVSIHINAAGADGKWHDATGWSGWVAPNASAASHRLAAILYAEAERHGLQGNRCVPAGRFWVGDYAIIRDTRCPAVLTENLFQDNRQEAEWLQTAEGKKTIVKLHADGIEAYLKTHKQ